MSHPADATVLVVDDEPDIADSMRAVLESEGYSVLLARDGQQALDVLDDREPDLIVSDVMMPVLDGFGFLRRYRARPGRHAPVIAVSAHTPYLAEIARQGAAATLAKPFSLPQMLATIDAVLADRPLPRATPPPAVMDEAHRLRALLDLRFDQPTLDASLNRFVEHVAAIFSVPTCLLSMVTEERQFWTVACGMPADLAPERGSLRSDSFCTHSVAARAALVVQDAADNPFFNDNLFVRAHGLRFYAGVPLFARSGEALGTLCIIDDRPRVFRHSDLELLAALARRVMAEIDRRAHARNPDEPASVFPHLADEDPELGVPSRTLFNDLLILLGCFAAEHRESLALVVVDLPPDELAAATARIDATLQACVLGRLARRRVGVLLQRRTSEQAEGDVRACVGGRAKLVSFPVNAYFGAQESALVSAEAALDRGDGGAHPNGPECVV